MRSVRYALAFSMLGMSAIVVGAMAGLTGVPLLWFGATMLLVGANYAFPRSFVVFHKKQGTLGIAWKLLLLPYMAMLHGTWHLLRITSSEAPFAEVTPGIYIGRRLLPQEYPTVTTVVDLTAELDDHVPKGANLLAFPILDGAPAAPMQLREMARKIGASERPIYLHCAQGHGRTSMVAAAVLLDLEVAKTIPQALELIQKVRPHARPNTEQRKALEAAFPDAETMSAR